MRHFSLYAAAMAALGISVSIYAAEPTTKEPTTKELMEQIEALKAKVEQLETAQQNQVTREDVDETVRSVLRDADKQSQLFAMEGFTAGYTDGKFILQSSDGNFLLHPYFQFQLRNTTSWRIDSKQPNNNDDMQNGFEIRRMKIGFDGNAFTKDLTYTFQWATDRKSGNLQLEDAWVKYKFSDSYAFRVGQFKDPLAHESLLSSKRLMTAERSFTNDFFSTGDDYVQGVTLIYDARGPLHVEGGFHDGGTFNVPPAGTRSNSNMNFQDFPTNNADWGAAARAEYKVMGDWKNYDDYTALGTKEDLLVFGVGVDYTESGDTAWFTHTVDAQFEMPCGLALYGAFYGRYTKDSPVGAVGLPPVGTGEAPGISHQDLYDWGFIAQAGYLINPKLELFARYGYLRLDEDGIADGVEQNVHEITAGGNYFLQGHNAKVTIDIGWLPNGAPFADDGAGILAGNDPSFYLRGQFQLLL
jgi:hypothetical protein